MFSLHPVCHRTSTSQARSANDFKLHSPSVVAQIITMKLLSQSVRRRPRTFILLLLFNFAFILYKMLPLLRLLSEDGSLNSISAMELISNPKISNKPHLIPKIIHQTYNNWSIPLKWQKAQNRTRTSHEDYEYKVRFTPFLRIAPDSRDQ
jgi:hypothetical protein